MMYQKQIIIYFAVGLLSLQASECVGMFRYAGNIFNYILDRKVICSSQMIMAFLCVNIVFQSKPDFITTSNWNMDDAD